MLPSPADYRADGSPVPPLTYMWFELATDFVNPGDPISLAWQLNRSNVDWSSVDVELFLVIGSDEEHLWGHPHGGWPARIVTTLDTDGIWPPVGMTSEDTILAPAARVTLFTGLGAKTLRLKVTGHKPAVADQVLTYDQTLNVIQPDNPLLISTRGPRPGSWNRNYTITGLLTNQTRLRLTCEIHTVASDDAVILPVSFTIESRDTASGPIMAPTRQSWTWFDQPTFHIREDQLGKSFTYTATATEIIDEFQNHYHDTSGLPLTIRVIVSESKQEAALEVQGDWWAGLVVTIVGVVAGIAAAFAPPIAIVAGGASGVTALLSYDGVQFAAIANDPPEPDGDYWAPIVLPELPPLPEPDELGALSKMLITRLRLGHLIQGLSMCAAKILGARQVGAVIAEAALQDRRAAYTAEMVELMNTLPTLVGPAVDSVANNPDFAQDAVQLLVNERAKTGFTPEEQDVLAKAFDAEYPKILMALAQLAATTHPLPPLSDLVKEMPFTTIAATSSAIDEIEKLLD